MDKKTIIAVVLSVIIITASFVIQSMFFPSTVPRAQPAPARSTSVEPARTPAVGSPAAAPSAPAPTVGQVVTVGSEGQLPAKSVKISTNVFEATFSNRGAVLTSLKLKAYKERNGQPVEMVISDDSGIYPFQLSLDDYNTGGDLFRVDQTLQPDQLTFSRDYVYHQQGRDIPFTLKKIFRFAKGDYMMEFRVSLETTGNEPLPIKAYRFIFGPQIGPIFEKLDNRSEYRHLIYYADGKRKDYTGKVRNGPKAIEEHATWAAIEGKYFLVTGISYVADLASYQIGFDTTPIKGLPEDKQDSLTFNRTVGHNNSIDEGYKFYIGPKKHDILVRYNDRNANAWRESGLHLDQAVASSFWGWLSDALKWLLDMFYRLIPNWGVAIILLTVFIKVLFWPLTHKSFEATSKMQALSPKLSVLKEKYKDNPQRLNQETAALYKREGVNPLGGCLPLLLQMPIFFALYRLFNDYFELRGAVFIHGWIPDLSGSEQFLTLPFAIPFLGNTLNLLPFLMLGMSFLQQLVSQTPGTQTTGQNKLLLYGMPLFFFFIMYNMPSGLLLYWTVQSMISFVQQFYINQLRAKAARSGTGDKR